MKPLYLHVALAGMLLLSAGSAAAGATVSFTEPERFTDVGRSPWERERVLKQVSAHFDMLAARLPAGQTLKVEVLDIDLAGHVEHHLIGHPDLRIVGRGADWPHMSLRYTITEGDKVVKSGEERLSSMSYMERYPFSRYRDEPLRYEKQMIDDWFKEKVALR
jgi:hypothetical protein